MMEFDEIVVKESPGLCRCCLSEGCYKDLGTEYTWMNETEVYADMLLECFDISITQHNEGPNGPNRLICEVCITRLRDACNFKKQVMDSEKKFIDMMGRGEFRPKMLIYQTKLKCEEPSAMEDPDETEVEYLEDDLDFGDDDLKEELIQPSVSDVTVATLPVKGKRGRPRKNTPVKPDKRAKVAKVVDKAKTSKAVAKAGRKRGRKAIKNSKPCLDEETHRTCKLFVDILETSTALPFRINNIKYRCFYCPRNFCLPSQLREHTQSEHFNDDPKGVVLKNITKAILKLDISELQCKICFNYFEDTDTFVAHLQKHKLKVDNDLTQILSFKLSDDVISCFICKTEFSRFRTLSEHTQRTQTDGKFPCEICNISVCTKISLAKHMGKEHKSINFDCDVCGKKFFSNYSKMHHTRRMHEIENRKCPFCFKILGSAYQKTTHLAKAHNVWTSQHKCNMCPRIFLKKDVLSKHIRREHFKEKNVTCEVCGQRFFDQHLLDNHKVKHDKIRPFKCVYCNKTFTRQKTLDVHERIHTNDRRCVCKECGEAFVQYASLHWHMRLHRNQKVKEETSAAEPMDAAVDE